MPRLDLESRRRVLTLQQTGYSFKAIKEHLKEKNIIITSQSLWRLEKKFCEHGTYKNLARRKRCKKLSQVMVDFMNDKMTEDDELTSTKLRELLLENWPELTVSLDTIKRYRRGQGWVCTRPHYCQLIRNINKRKRVAWCKEELKSKDDFADLIFSDECTVQLEQHGRLCFRKRKQPRKLKPRPKHPPKLHIWGAISFRGASQIVMFTGNMDAPRYEQILERSLVPFIQCCYPDGHRFQQDNNPKHTSKHIEDYFESRQINWWRTPPESPDLNPIENVWGALKQYLRNTYKPKNMTELKAGIEGFWQSLTPEVCQRYINHLKKVIPKIIKVDGNPSGC